MNDKSIILEDQQRLLDNLMKEAVLPPKRKKTLFDISGTSSREVVFSNWYKYFLNPEEGHGLGHIFMESLLELMGKPIEMLNFKVQTEVFTKNGNRIDILVSGAGSDEGKYLIIENKIYHHLANDLSDYWEHLNTNVGDKAGVLLTLKRTRVPVSHSGNFKNILHDELMAVVTQKISEPALSQEQLLYFTNFRTAIKNLNRFNTMDASVSFYFRNAESINSLISCKEEAKTYVSHQLQAAAEQLEMENTETDSYRSRGFIPNGLRDFLIYGIVFENLFSEKRSLRICLGLRKKSIGRVSELDEVFRDEIKHSGLELNASKGLGWHNYLTKIYELNETEFANLTDFVTEKINNNFKMYTDRIGAFLIAAESERHSIV